MPFLFYFVVFVFQDKLSLCSPGGPGTHRDYIHCLGKEQCLSRHLHISWNGVLQIFGRGIKTHQRPAELKYEEERKWIILLQKYPRTPLHTSSFSVLLLVSKQRGHLVYFDRFCYVLCFPFLNYSLGLWIPFSSPWCALCLFWGTYPLVFSHFLICGWCLVVF